ncbi:FHA domain-containing protein [Streptomyces sp. AK02-01A]|uniref:FHA domain-containing protein n=1 Tax=Streptomyces sp. AK02-01A TaxID=3028648 RepID=UPI0029A159A9|nr:FHA domain-containing protein [Streptomyces sp. AK02-01A]MDX3849275.1 FHA domain-containing protein [Streptomyces sp. AK02-01A]
MPTCPNGHQSGSDDWCEVCGHRMAAPGAPTGAVPPPPPPPPPGYGYPPGPRPGSDATAQAELCPQCRTPREPMAPFCEECRWNFLTNTATSYTPLAPQHPLPGNSGPAAGGPVPGLNLPPGFQAQRQPPRPPDPYEYQGSRPSQLNRPAEPLAPEGPSAPSRQSPRSQGPDQGPQQGPQQHGPLPPRAYLQGTPAPQAPPGPARTGDDDWMLPPPSHAQAPRGQAPQRQDPPQQQAPRRQVPPQQQDPLRQYQAPAAWTAVIGPDREYFMAMMQRSGPEATGLNLPAYSPEQRLELSGNQVTIGRRRHSTGESPDIDLSVPPEDPGVSHQHAVLVHQPDGSWAVVDQNSTNGTTLNGAEDPIQPYVPVPLKDGDRVHVGAWTTITVRRG